MSRALPERPSLDHLRKQAKRLLRAHAAGDPGARARFGSWKSPAPPALADAQRVIAREYGYPSWARLKHDVESLAGTDAARALAAAIRLNDAARVRDVLARFDGLAARLDDALPDAGFGETPLIAAAQRGNREMVDVLLEAGADPNQRSHWWAGGFSALGEDAATREHLIARGAVVDAYDAAKYGMFDRLRDLVTADPGVVHARFGDGQTALHAAATVEIAAFLLDRGAHVDARDVDHESTPAQYLIRRHPDVARYLVSRGADTDILMAAALGDAALVRRRLDADPGAIRTTVSDRWFPMRDPRAGGTIYIWTLGNHKSVHDVARESGAADVLALLDARTPASLALAVACESEDEEAVTRLRAEAGDPLTLAPDEAERIVSAACRGRPRAVRLMLRAGWPATARDASGATALHWAAFHGDAALVRELLDAGADAAAIESRFNGAALGWARNGAEHSWRREEGDYAATERALTG